MTAADLSHIAKDLRALARPVADLEPLDRNPRQGDVEAIVASLRKFGQRKPIVARYRTDDELEVTAGNHTLYAARVLGWTHIAVVLCDDDETTARSFALIDNVTHDRGTYDEILLDAMLKELAVELPPEDPIGALVADLEWTMPDFDGNPAEPGGVLVPPEQSGSSIQYHLDFVSEADRAEFHGFLDWLRSERPEPTVASRLLAWIREQRQAT